MVPVQHFESSSKVVGLSPYHADIDYQSEMFNVRISFRWRPTINQNLIDEIEQWTATPAAIPTFLLIGEA
jgi:hypothetical protein